MKMRSTSGGPTTPASPRRSVSASSGAGMPLVPSLGQSQLTQNMANSMTIEEMRFLHQKALKEAEAKRTELRLVLASRYRELVGSSDEVIKMKERSSELQELVQALPGLMLKLTEECKIEDDTSKEADRDSDDSTIKLRRELSLMPRVIHRALDNNDVYSATVSLVQLFTLIASQTDIYPLANVLSTGPVNKASADLDPALDAQMRMIFLQVQTLPDKIVRISNRSLSKMSIGALQSAAALASLDFLGDKKQDRAETLLTNYFDSKAALLVSLLNKLNESTDAEEIMSKIVWILQRDVVVHPYQIFVIRKFEGSDRIMSTLPLFDKIIVKNRCSKFMAKHLPLIRTKVKSVLVTIAGTTASALGQIRQSLYDKTDGVESMERLNENGICSWDEAVCSMIDIRTVLNSADADSKDRFSLWGALFSHTFSSLVHSLLTTSFQSVHTQVVTTLRASLANAPPVSAVLPHEAYRNTLKIATELDRSLLKVSEDAHKLLVHAEEREESERRLRQSLYVQTCEIMGRLICELRRMAVRADSDTSDSTKELIVGRLCFLLKFRLTSLRTLLSPESSPASMNATSGMISPIDLQSAFELADDNEDGLITFEEAIEAVESAFSGTPFNGAEMVRETLLLSAESKETTTAQIGGTYRTPANVTLCELTLLTARGLRHDKSGASSALGTVQMSLDAIVSDCFQKWAKSSLSFSAKVFEGSLQNFMLTASSIPDNEWKRIFSRSEGDHHQTPADACKGVSPLVVGFLLDVAAILNRNACPSDSLSPVPNVDFASALGIEGAWIPSLMDTMRRALLSESFIAMSSLLEEATTSEAGADLEKSGASGLFQLHVDVSFVKLCYLERNQFGFGLSENDARIANSKNSLETVMHYADQLLATVGDRLMLDSLSALTSKKHQRVLETSDLFFSSLFGDDKKANVSASGELLGSAEGTEPFFHVPLASTRRFALLPVQADRSLSDIQIRGKYAKEQEEEMDRRATHSGNVISGGFGFLSNMLKTHK